MQLIRTEKQLVCLLFLFLVMQLIVFQRMKLILMEYRFVQRKILRLLQVLLKLLEMLTYPKIQMGLVKLVNSKELLLR